MIFFILIGILVLTLVKCYRRNFNYWSHYKNVVSSVPGSIFSGNFLDFLTFKTNFIYHIKAIYDEPEFANKPVVGIYTFYKPSLLIKDPELIKRILIKDFDYFHDRFAKPDIHKDPIGGNILLFLAYNEWKDVRSKVSPIFSSGKLKFMYPLIQQVGENMESSLMAQERVTRLDMKEFCSRYTSDVTATTLFGFSANSVRNPQDRVYQQIRKLTFWDSRRAFDFLLIFYMPKMANLLSATFYDKETENFLTSIFNQMMAERERSGEKRNDLFDIFVKLQQEAVRNGEDVGRLRELLLSQLSIFLAAGFESTSTTISNALLQMAKNPETQTRLRNEILQTATQGKGEISYDLLTQMTYLDMVVNETLRLYPVLPLLDRKYSDVTGKGKPYSLKPFCDFDIPEGMPIYISLFALSYDPQYWPNPTQFDPERFTPENIKMRHPMVNLPFGNGPRNCVGSRLGLLQIKTGLVYLLRNHFVRVYDATVMEPKFEPKTVILQVKGGIHLEIVRDDMCIERLN